MRAIIVLVGIATILAVMMSGCLTVYADCEEIYTDSYKVVGNVEDSSLMGGSDSDSGKFLPNEYSVVGFENSRNPITKTDDSTTFTVRIKASDVSNNGVGSNLILYLNSDSGAQKAYDVIIPDYDGYTHWIIVQPSESFQYYDTNADGVIGATIEHMSSDSNYVKIYALKYRVNYDSASSTSSDSTTSTSTGYVEFYTDPIGSNVYVDGKFKGQTSAYAYGVLKVELTEGSHSYTISKDGYASESGTIRVVAGDTVYVTETLSSSGSSTSTTPTASNVPPTAIITATQPTQTMIIFGSDKSTDSDGSIASREWKLNGQKVSSAIQYQFTTSDKTAGTYSIELTVTDDDGATGLAQYQITIEDKMITQTTENTVTAPETNSPGENTQGGNEGTTFVIPGFESVFALIGLVAVSWAVRRTRDD